MKLTIIFFLLSCIHINYIHCKEADQKDKPVIPKLHSEIGKNYLTPLKEISTPETDRVKSKPRTRNLPEALELLRVEKTKKDGKKFDIRRDFIPLAQITNVENVAYFCPPEFEKQHKRSEKPKFQFCLYLKERSNVVLDSVDCIHEPQPLLWSYPDEENIYCGEDHMARLYRFCHKVCWKDKSLLLKLPKLNDERDRIKKMQRETIEIYSICLRKLEQVLYLKYDLIIASDRELNRIREDSYELQTNTKGYGTFLDIKNWSKLFETKNLQIFLKKTFGNKLDDTLIPQMLISQTHMKPNLAKNTLHNYLNIKPQWQSVENNWLRLEYHIRNLGLQYSRGIIIYAGTYNYDKVDEKKREQLTFQIGEFSQSIPFIWWKLITNKNNEGIILAVQNEPKVKGKSYSSEKLCKKSICKTHGWNEVDEFGYCCAFDEEKRKLLNLRAEKIKIFRVFNPTKHRSRLTTWFLNKLKI